MILVGLTGGIGSGKSTVINHFKELGVNCYQADKEAKKLMDSDHDLIRKIQNSFGDNIYINSKLDRKKLASIVFNNKEKLDLLNSLVHPAVNNHFINYCIGLKDMYIIKEVAIIFETKTQDRIINRDKCNRQEAIDRINNQIDDEDKVDKSDYIIENINIIDIPKRVLKIHKNILNTI